MMRIKLKFSIKNPSADVNFRNVYPFATGGTSFKTDETLTLKDGILSVNTADVAEADNTLPITSAAVASQVGNIEIILKTI